MKTHRHTHCFVYLTKQCYHVLLDLTNQRFDNLGHNILVSQLQHLVDICGSALDWFRSYLAGRTLCLSFGGSESSYALLSYGVPRGSILEHLLF